MQLSKFMILIKYVIRKNFKEYIGYILNDLQNEDKY